MLMNDSNFFIMLVNTPWVGPALTPIQESDIKTNRGVHCDSVEYVFKYSRCLNDKADNQNDFPLCDILETGKHLFFSERFIEILRAEGVNTIQYFDCDIVLPSTLAPLGFKIECCGVSQCA